MSKEDKSKRRFLFLQGVCSPFFARLANQLMTHGHAVYKVNFNCGDSAYWGGRGLRTFSFREPLANLRDFLDEIYNGLNITDQILFGDRRPVHRPAVSHGEIYGIRTHVFEEGYFRPYWVTLERDGVNGHSLLPRDPDWFWSVGGDLQDTEEVSSFISPFAYRALHDLAYHSVGALNVMMYPSYRTHSPVIAPIEYLGYATRFTMLRFVKDANEQLIRSIVSSGDQYFVLPLQLNSDAQIRDHSRFDDMQGVIDVVMNSFAQHAKHNARLVIKNHPLDMGLAGYRKSIDLMSKQYGIDSRVDYLETGNLEQLLQNAAGVVTVNSTVGSYALGLGCPTVTLSDPIYNLPGLTFQGGLDDFWCSAEGPNRELFRRFRNAVIYATQVNGGFYCRKGIDLAVKNSAAILEGEVSPLEALL